MLNIDLNRIALILQIPLSLLYPVLFYPFLQLVAHFLATSLSDSTALRFVHPLVCWLSPSAKDNDLFEDSIYSPQHRGNGYDFFSSSHSFPGESLFDYISYDETLTMRELSSNSPEWMAILVTRHR